MRPIASTPALAVAPALAFALALTACGTTSPMPVALGIGPTPRLPAPTKSLLPTINVATAEGWAPGQMPTPAAGLRVNEFGGGL